MEQWSTKTPGSTRLQGTPRLQWSKTPVEQWSTRAPGSTMPRAVGVMKREVKVKVWLEVEVKV